MKEHFSKYLVMTQEEEHLFQQSNTSWICKKHIEMMMKKLKIIVTLLVNS